MNYSVIAHPVVRMDLMVDKKYAPQLVGYIQRMNCTYAEERECEPGNGKNYILLKDVKGPNGGKLGELLGLFYSLEWGNLVNGDEQSKFYILLNPRRKGKKNNVCENREETGSGSEGGDRGEAPDTAGSGPVAEPAGDGNDDGTPGTDNSGDIPERN